MPESALERAATRWGKAGVISETATGEPRYTQVSPDPFPGGLPPVVTFTGPCPSLDTVEELEALVGQTVSVTWPTDAPCDPAADIMSGQKLIAGRTLRAGEAVKLDLGGFVT